MVWLLPFSDYGWVFSDKYTRNMPIYIYATLNFFSMFQMDYEPLDTTLNDGFVTDDLNVSRRPSL